MIDYGLSIATHTREQQDEDNTLGEEGSEFTVADSAEPTGHCGRFASIEYCGVCCVV